MVTPFFVALRIWRKNQLATAAIEVCNGRKINLASYAKS